MLIQAIRDLVPESRSARLLLALLLALLFLLFLLYWESWKSMVGLWMGSENFAHSILVPPIFAWLVWRLRAELAAQCPKPAPAAALLVLLCGLTWLIGELAGVNALQHFAQVGMLVALVPTLMGWSLTWTMAFPLGFLFLGVPFGEFLYPTLMAWTADYTVAALRLTGIPVYREGLQFVIPSGNWSVVEACSGLRYFTSLLMVSLLFAYLNYRGLKKRLIFVVAASLVTILANWLRAYLVVMTGHLSNNKYGVGYDHVVFGWVLFGLVAFLLFFIGARFADDPEVLEAEPVAVASHDARPPVAWRHAVVMGLGGLLAPLLLLTRLQVPAEAPPPHLPPWAETHRWKTLPTAEPEFRPDMAAPHAVLEQSFVGPDGQRVGLYLGYYRRQDEQRQLASSWNQVATTHSERWTVLKVGVANLEASGRTLELEETLLRDRQQPSRQVKVWRLFWVDGTWTASPEKTKLLELKQRLLGRGDDGAVLILFADASTQGGGSPELTTFLQENLPFVERQLRHTQAAVARP